ncbi:hypothetical protein F2Q68_00026681 [Brassica cretica]|uniref:Replication factor A C-terminal domain-containing protein n=1 Tax=Brassica cretica TaxID=69181 RepID=A0A8S9IE23_BRACR|nr:hypothetical protein F2Q68_00026681 [Brassica cretica]
MAMKQNGKALVSSDSEERVMLFKDVSLGPHAAQLRFRLIHFWEARNPIKKTLIGLEMLLIDEQGTVIQGFIPPGRIKKYWPEMKQGSVYQLENFYGSKNKPVYRVADHIATVSFTWNSEMSVLHEVPISFDEDRFRFHSYEDFEANCDLKGDLYDIFSYMTQESAKCTATIDDVVHGSAWYYIACSACHSKATKGATSLICTNTRCGKVNTTGVAQYCAKISVYDNSEQAFFVLLGDAGRELTGRHASELVNSYFEANKNEGPDHEVPVPEALINTIGQTHKFSVKVTEHNFSGNTRAITVTKILSLDTPPPTEASVGNNIAATSEETMQTGNEVFEPSKSRGDSGNEESKRTSASADPEKSKRPRCEK